MVSGRKFTLKYPFLKRGILLVSPDIEHQGHISDEIKKFMINDREFMFLKVDKSKKPIVQSEAGDVDTGGCHERSKN